MDKEFKIKIGGIKESVSDLTSLEEILKNIETKADHINNKGGIGIGNSETSKQLNELGKLEKKIAEYDNEYNKAIIANKTYLAERNAELKNAIQVENAYNVIQNETATTYQEKQKRLSALGKVIKSMTTETEEEKREQQELIREYSALNQELKNFDATLGNHQRSVGDYEIATKDLRGELREMQLQMATMLAAGVNKLDPAFVELSKKAGVLKDAMGDAREEIDRFASDTKKLDDVIDIATSATAAFELYAGAMSAFGLETEETEKAMQKLMGAMSIIQSLKTLQESLEQNSATAKLLNGAMNALSLGIKGTTTATKALRIALMSVGIGIIIALVATLIANWEDLVGWFKKTFPVLNNLGAKIKGIGNAIKSFLINPIADFANVMKLVFAGKFSEALDAAKKAISKRLSEAKEAYNVGYQEEMTKKATEESNKRTKQELAELKIQERHNKTYSKKYIALQKKDFAERKLLAKGNEEELEKIKLEEMQFFADVEDKKTAAAKAGAAERTKAAKEAAKEEKEELKRILTARRALRDEILNNDILELKQKERLQALKLEGYETGPIEKYNAELEKLKEIQDEIADKENALSVAAIGDYLEDNIESVKKSSSEWQVYISNIQHASDITLKLTKSEMNQLLTQWQKIEGLKLKAGDEANAQIIDKNKKTISVLKAELDGFSKEFERKYNELFEKVKKKDVKSVKKDNIWGKLFGTIDVEKTQNKLEKVKEIWTNTYSEINSIYIQSQNRWDEYLETIKEIYGEDSNRFKEATQEKIDALEKLGKKLTEVGKRANTPTSSNNDYNGDDKADSGKKRVKSHINEDEFTTTDDGKTNWKALWSEDNSFVDNLLGNFDLLSDTVLNPAMDTFTMFMDFAIEETAQRLAEVEKMHDEALEKVNESADKIKELNESLKDASTDNRDAVKQQLADEQLLYAQRLAEEQKLAEEETALKNKQAEQEAKARKVELGYQMVMAIANTAQGATKAMATWGWPLGAIFAGVMTALGLAQVALIAKQMSAIKPVKYAEGGILQGKTHAQGGIPVGNTGIEVEGGEMVVSKKNTERYKDVLYKINRNDPSVRYLQGSSEKVNADTKIRKFADGGQLNFEAVDSNLRENANTNRLINALSAIDMHPVVSVTDFHKVENRLVKVRGLAGR